MTTIILVVGYPDTFCFETERNLPEFKYAEKTRQALLLDELERQRVWSPSHAYEDFVIEQIRTIKVDQTTQVEHWHLGS